MTTTDYATADRIERLYREYKPLLTAVAYRMLGSVSEAEDAVQDVFVAVSKPDAPAMAHPRAYLLKLVTNRALNMMKAAPRKRETYPGPWLPEPVIAQGPEDTPQELVLRRERLGYALLVLLATCTPAERAVFVLRESLGLEYGEIANMLDRSEAACRKLFSRASAKLGQRPSEGNEEALDATVERFVQSFAQALENGRFDSLLRLLTRDAVMLSDGGGVVRAALRPIQGRDRITAFFAGIARKGSLQGRLLPVRISGQPGLLLIRPDRPPLAFAWEPTADFSAIRTLYLVSNPEKLTRIRLADSHSPGPSADGTL
ncbi:sigma-70 family RNA polymerase sigma factor [Gorillibacterium sp. sgz5001074]|uniref:sigma-70 family RNA polymerase sigma factor n=1 Tax=Gorillibacterium sp. sgz5001074 TaxID=3446695 RepID=UPI003F673C82